ncbi:hypothetical protein SALWKB29_0484 [Snodgrassella communis]|uniref:Uncharacterized protein n=1 Tax=Snodgrassella communis TaxID=2946699 RepID=A0A836MSH2_9NEIS|nr:hypothetical protein SALWKB29_0484 [Snodgrassella communis]
MTDCFNVGSNFYFHLYIKQKFQIRQRCYPFRYLHNMVGINLIS